MEHEGALCPFPNGWYAIGLARDLPPGSLLTRSFMGQEIVVFRTRSGAICAADAYCPHLGAHFGFGGRVEGEVLQCPFHGFCFDSKGICVKTGYDTPPPPTARLKLWQVRELNGLLLLYYHAEGRAPEWEVPVLAMAGWTTPIARSFTLHDHPQETTENSVDVGHFAIVHHYRDVMTTRDPVVDGPYLSTAYRAMRPLPLLSRFQQQLGLAVAFETHIYGLGYSLVDVAVPRFRTRARLWVLPTPIDTTRLTLRLVVSVHGTTPWHQLIARGTLFGLVNDARQDFPIWEHKRYIQPPALAKGDGPIGKYRNWAKQFYG